MFSKFHKHQTSGSNQEIKMQNKKLFYKLFIWLTMLENCYKDRQTMYENVRTRKTKKTENCKKQFNHKRWKQPKVWFQNTISYSSSKLNYQHNPIAWDFIF